VLQAAASGLVFVERSGDEPAQVIGLHGWGRTRSDLLPALRAPALAGAAYASLDLPGFGHSPEPAPGIGAREYAEIVRTVLTEVAAGPCVLVGHSFGGRVAVCLAAQAPELVRGLVLTGVPLIRREPARKPVLRYRVGRTLHHRGLLSDARMDALRQKYGSADYRAASPVMRTVLVTVVAESYEDELRALQCPTTLAWGARDTVVPLSVAEAALEIASSAALDVIADADHDLPVTHPDVIASACRSLLAADATH
jgi:pimeloyl-ACP methyl ester carboxylesterase